MYRQGMRGALLMAGAIVAATAIVVPATGQEDRELTSGTWRYGFRIQGADTRVARLAVDSAERDSLIEVYCTGRTCPFRLRGTKPLAGPNVNVRRELGLEPVRLRSGQKLELKIIPRTGRGKWVDVFVHYEENPKVREGCLSEGGGSRTSCD